AAPATPSSDGQATQGGGPEPGRSSRRGRRGRRRGGHRPDAAQGRAEGAPDTAAVIVTPAVTSDGAVTTPGDTPSVKPSDVSARTRPAGRSNGSRKGRPRSDGGTARDGRRRDDGDADAPKLRTVRETSAGGLIVSGIDGPDDARCAALIGRVDRRGRMMWSLPKGHIETGETAEQTAVREVAEETGIEGNVVAPLGKIDYWFVSEGKRIHKTVHHYLMRSTGGELSDADYEVAEVAWVPLTELPHRLTYSDERRLARAATQVIADLADDPELLARSEADSQRTEPNDYEKAAAARNQRRNEPARPVRPRRRRRREAPGTDTAGG
ncbi:NUDIX hydrolase, partial [Williamsia deligens]